ncbi:hypothetical protein [Pedobacter duraquae]|uniref:Uncharacterized protein n=1 Tax=Pedobacter duraquae TaxID=425511 RepID=A0A4V3C3K0_9SPHI|nr:hypothetical protein [Pedobacter duraquae]TDO22368.1 hypothetical protein CLV32_1337 [Pedobacter duraquae]
MESNLNSIASTVIINIENNIAKILPFLNEKLVWPELESVKSEILMSILTGCNQAAITLINHWLERSFKMALIYHTSGGRKDNFTLQAEIYESAIKKYDNCTLNDNINSCYDLHLIDDAIKTSLTVIRKKFRNAYSHAEANKIFDNLAAPISISATEKAHQFSIKSQSIAYMPLIYGLAQEILAEEEAFPYFLSVREIINHLAIKVENIKI